MAGMVFTVGTAPPCRRRGSTPKIALVSVPAGQIRHALEAPLIFFGPKNMYPVGCILWCARRKYTAQICTPWGTYSGQRICSDPMLPPP